MANRIVAVDRAAGTITVAWEPDVVTETFFGALTDVLKEYYADVEFVDTTALNGTVASFRYVGGVRRVGAPPITPAVVVTLATLGAFEWLRHRKAEVARAEASGDYTTILAEFVTWLRALLDSWRRAAPHGCGNGLTERETE